MADELLWGHEGKDYVEACLRLLQWIPEGSNYHTKMVSTSRSSSLDTLPSHEKICKDSSSQVKHLIDMATDPNVLSRSWVGWSAWA